ncbi:MAG: hypothetical protein Q8914_14385, partial [Bacteroidota bacterium]|nr:hypothetical protein [Bacteroidota bacterium]
NILIIWQKYTFHTTLQHFSPQIYQQKISSNNQPFINKLSYSLYVFYMVYQQAVDNSLVNITDVANRQFPGKQTDNLKTCRKSTSLEKNWLVLKKNIFLSTSTKITKRA